MENAQDETVISQPELPGVETTLEERELIHGDFAVRAAVAVKLKALLTAPLSDVPPPAMMDYERHALDMICEKLSRIACGNPHFSDTWRDIAGYAMLVCNEIEREQQRTPETAAPLARPRYWTFGRTGVKLD